MNPTDRLLALGCMAVAVALLGACGDSDRGRSASEIAVVGTTDTPYGLVSADTAVRLAADPDIVIVDVRTPSEFAEGHLDRAIEIDFNADDFSARIEELDTAATYLVYCRSGSRSANATAMMRSAGIDRIYELDGGIVAWTEAGLNVVTSD